MVLCRKLLARRFATFIIREEIFDAVRLPTGVYPPCVSTRGSLPRLTPRVKNKFGADKVASEVTALCATAESSNLAISYIDRPGLSPNLRRLSGLVVFFIISHSQVQVEVEALFATGEIFFLKK